jgi:hypothetical protein
MFLRSRAAVVLALAAGIVVPGAAAHSAKTCLENEMTTLSEILREAQEADVFVRIDKQHAYGDDSKQYDELCNAYEKTSEERKKQVKIVKVNGDNDGADIVKELDAEDEEAWPTYFLFKKGTKNSDLKPKFLEDARYSGEERSSEKLAEYLQEKTGASIGSFVYSLGMMDTLASKFMSAKDSESAAFRDIQRRVILYSAKFLGIMVKIRADSELKMVTDLYVKAFTKSMESDEYAQKQIDRIKKLMEKDNNNMSNAKREQMSQKVHILTKFAEPKELTAAENRSLLINIGMNAALFIAFIITFLQMIFGSEEEKKEEGDGEGGNGDDEKEEEKEE